jgi:hypothetical protein
MRFKSYADELNALEGVVVTHSRNNERETHT